MNIEEISKILEPIYGQANREILRHLQLREGVAVATDGAILVRVDVPGFVPTPEQVANVYEPAFKIKPQPPVLRVTDRDWIMKPFGVAVEREWVAMKKRHEKEEEDAIAEFNRRSTKCPCCGEDVAIIDCESWSPRGRLRSLDEWIEEEAPPPEKSPAYIALRGAGLEENFRVFVRDIYRALIVALRLGRADELLIAEHQLQLVGKGFSMIVVNAGWVEASPAWIMDLPDAPPWRGPDPATGPSDHQTIRPSDQP